ncbi:hypothetical protein P6709_01780 [Jeotgalibacillus sp. ET6]|uniref:hypothetical protein n=1 Tax=Jeotgalibacillus sp. ET6 TaxID=3037260 RepID=UPI002418BC20|nr:hypothetical protein [Jeotgalibacillus sp. ET6]MDG5470459.1 hypothetical protein [Jeotgalibacillus sp. ET6]
MWNQLVEEQIALQGEIAARNKLIRRKNILEEELHNQKRKRDQAYQLFTKEQQDVHDLDQFSFINLFREVTGKKEQMRKRELAQAAEAELKCNEGDKMVRDVQKDYEAVVKKLQNPIWTGLDQEWDLLMEKKENWLRSHTQTQRQQLDSLQILRRDLDTLVIEMNEALTAGEKALLALENAFKHMQSAKDMSTWDTFLGGGLIATAMKHSRLDDSEDAIHKAQLELQRFETELQDIDNVFSDDLRIDRGSFLTFADYFFDDLFSEWTVHSRINKTMDNLKNVLHQAEQTCEDLKVQITNAEDQLAEVMNDTNALVEGMELY